jgi:Flp pilus assembly pilin Flp
MQKNRAAEMMEVAVVVGVVIALIAVFQQLQKAVGDKISDAATKVSGSGKTK